MKQDPITETTRADVHQAQSCARVTARLLDAGRVLATCSACAVLISAISLVSSHAVDATVASARMWVLWAVVLAGAPAAWYAWRTRLDRGLFADLADAIAANASTDSALSGLDAAMHALGIVASRPGALRPLLDRALGARRLLIAQALLAIARMAVAAALLMPLPRP